ncbi:ATP-dependent zinc metalloprotease FtsH [Arthrobacter sp. Hiyo4]|nr:ATP-dependent zinc metalloprotease FtsH [Arthrobacter sp. Hiyo4]
MRRLIDQAHDEAYAILTENRDVLDQLALELLERETLNQAEIAHIFTDIRKRDFREVWLSKETRPVQQAGPVESRLEKSEREAQEEAKEARLEEPLDALPPHPQGVPDDAAFQGGIPDSGLTPRTAKLSPVTHFDDDDAPASAGHPAEDGSHHKKHEKVDRPRIEAAVREILLAIGEDPDRGGLVDTPDGWPRPTPRCSRDCTTIPRTSFPPPSTWTTKNWSWSRTSRSTQRASTTSCRSTGLPTSATFPPTTAK